VFSNSEKRRNRLEGGEVAVIKIVCDASYDKDLCFAGYAGIINIQKLNPGGQNVWSDEQTITYAGVVAEQKKSQESETFAILAGLQQLCQRQLNGAMDLVNSTIDVYSDCRATRERFYNFEPSLMPENDQEHGYLKDIYELIHRHQCRLRVIHVAAHMPDHQATDIQKLNNLVDKRAREIRFKAMNAMLQPESAHSPIKQVVVLLPQDPLDIMEKRAWDRLANHLAEKGKFIHLYIQGNPDQHSFITVLHDFALSQQTNLSDLVKIYTYTPDFFDKPLNKCELTLLRYHMKMRNLNSNVQFTYDEVHIRAAIASRLIFGELSPEVMSSHFFGRQKPPVDAVYDLMGRLEPNENSLPGSVQGWIHTFLNYTNIPLAIGLSEVFSHEGLKTEVAPSTRESYRPNIEVDGMGSTDYIPHADEKLLTAFTEIYENSLAGLSSRELNYKELAQRFIHEYLEQGHEFPKLSEASIERFVYTNRKQDPQSFVLTVLKQIKKLAP